jgi:hypothetical protein
MPSNRLSINNILNSIIENTWPQERSTPSLSPPPQSSDNMPPSATRTSRKRSAAQLTSSDPPSPSSDSGPSSSKRRRTSAGQAVNSSPARSGSAGPSGSSSRAAPIDIEEVDLTEDGNVLAETLQKQRAEQVKAQAPQLDGPPTLKKFTCVICMDTPEDLTATSCGMYFHLFPFGLYRARRMLTTLIT